MAIDFNYDLQKRYFKAIKRKNKSETLTTT